jgi:AGZA family xanthine/uracil permease-like MFS transporter
MTTALTRRLGPWRPGDLDRFLALGLNNLIQILLIISLCSEALSYPDALLFGQILPGAGVSLLVGNLAYTHLGVC